MRKKFLFTGMLTMAAFAAVTTSGCAEKKEGPQTVIIELSDPSDAVEELTTDAAVEETSEAATAEATSTEAIDTEFDSQDAEVNGYPQIEGLSDDVTLSYTQIGSADPIIGMVIAEILPDIHATDLDITSVQAYKDAEEVIPAGDLTFSLDVAPDASVVLYRLDAEGKVTSEQLEVTDGTVSYQTSNCGRWLVINTNLESESEAVTEAATPAAEVETTLAETVSE